MFLVFLPPAGQNSYVLTPSHVTVKLYTLALLIFNSVFCSKLSSLTSFCRWRNLALGRKNDLPEDTQLTTLRAQSHIVMSFFFLSFNLFICLYFISGCAGLPLAGSLELCEWGLLLLQWGGFSPWWSLLLWGHNSRCVGFSSCAHGRRGSTACGIFPDHGLCPALAGRCWTMAH